MECHIRRGGSAENIGPFIFVRFSLVARSSTKQGEGSGGRTSRVHVGYSVSVGYIMYGGFRGRSNNPKLTEMLGGGAFDEAASMAAEKEKRRKSAAGEGAFSRWYMAWRWRQDGKDGSLFAEIEKALSDAR